MTVFQASLHFIALVEAFDGFDVRGFRRVGRACTGFFGFRIPKSHNVHTLPREPHNLRHCSHRETHPYALYVADSHLFQN